MSDNIKVVVKVRPLISREIEKNLALQWRVNNNTLYQIDPNGKDSGQTFTFDKVYDEKAKTAEVYNDVAKPIVEAATAGFNGTIFAYGQTSSGKTYTMAGTEDSPGIIQMAVLDLFDIISKTPNRDFLVRVCYMEIYNDTLIDLLDKTNNIKINENYEGTIILKDIEEKVTSSPDDVLEIMKVGDANRQTGATNMNEKSSRSHSIFQITVESRSRAEGGAGGAAAGCVHVSQLNLVDLAGSERADASGATGQRFREGTHINRSLFSLTLVIRQLSETSSDSSRFVNYRDSKLTRILQNSLGGNAKTSIICAITPAALDETISTLKFATRAKKVTNMPSVNAVATQESMIEQLTKEMARLQAELNDKRKLEVMLENQKQTELDLQKRIQKLREVIIHGFAAAPGATRAPRRVTISAVHAPEPAPPRPRFHTPVVKYNPLLVPGPSDFAPIQSNRRLASLPEEPRLVTPPLKDKKIDQAQEIIDLDSDDELDESLQSIPTCSPYHKCRDTTKTPPCVLRKNSKQAEKNLKDILKLTEREKIYTPNVVELMEKLEVKTSEMGKLEDEIEALRTATQQKDTEISSLKSVISSTEEDNKRLKSIKSDLESQCKKNSTKVTEWEIIYETLQRKAKLREEELLSLLEEHKHRFVEDISKMPFKQKEKEIINFMDMSKDISLVNSDNESSIVQTEDEESSQTQNMTADLQKQLANKNETIQNLEKVINEQKEVIESMEESNRNIEKIVNECKEEMGYLESENTLLKTTMETLHATIKSQKESMEIAERDLKSCYSVIKELQIKLSSNMSKDFIEDFIENMIVTEHNVIANNDNIRNIIHSLKLALGTRKKEVDGLKDAIRAGTEKAEHLSEELEVKSKEMEALNEELLQIKEKLHVEQDLTDKIKIIEFKNTELEKSNKANLELIQSITKTCEILKVQLAERLEKEAANLKLIENLDQTITAMSAKVKELETRLKDKDDIINNSEDSQKHIEIAKHLINKMQNIFTILNADVRPIPDVIDNLLTVFNIFSENVNSLEEIAVGIVTEKDSAKLTITELQNSISELSHNKKELPRLQNDIKNLATTIEGYKKEINESENIRKHLEAEMSNMKVQNERLGKEYDAKFNQVKLLEDKLNQEIDTNVQKVNTLNNTIVELQNEVTQMSLDTVDLRLQIKESEQSKESFIKDCKEKLVDLMRILNVENGFAAEDNYNEVFHIIEVICNKIQEISKTHNDPKSKENEIEILTNQNIDMSKLLVEIENENTELRNRIALRNQNNLALKENLDKGNELFETLKEQLEVKSYEIIDMEGKVREWKDQFESFDVAMKAEMQNLQHENQALKTKLIDSKRKSMTQFDLLNNSDLKTPKKSDNTNSVGLISPPSLLTICCNRIVEVIEPKTNDSDGPYSSDSNTEVNNVKETVSCEKCNILNLELDVSQQKNARLMAVVETLETLNDKLLVEQEDIKKEIALLIGPAQELQKKILSHKTNLSILTATTYAENKSLQSQVKGLQHHHVRFHNVCQRDIPEFKRQLCELMSILKGDPSFSESINFTLKRYSLPNVLNDTTKAMNESTLDGDMLMLDTNITLTTADNTVVGYDQTCLDLTQTFEGIEDTNLNNTESNVLHNQMEDLQTDNNNMFNKLEDLEKENSKLKNLLQKCPTVDAKCSPIKISESVCKKCMEYQQAKIEVDHLKQMLSKIEAEKQELQNQYKSLNLGRHTTDVLQIKIKTLEKELNSKLDDLAKLKSSLDSKMKEIKTLQEENDSLSSQVMENISETDDLNQELGKLKRINEELREKCQLLEKGSQTNDIEMNNGECSPKESPTKARLSRSLSDSETSSRLNKISTLQSELHAGREDCKVLTEDVATIKQHLDCSSMSMDLDDSMSEFSLAPEYQSPKPKKSNMPDIQEEIHDLYKTDKIECYNYLIEKTGVCKSLNSDFKIIEIMKLFYNSLLSKQSEEVENLYNKLRDYEKAESNLKSQIDNTKEEYTKVNQQLEQKIKILNTMSKVQTYIKDSLNNAATEVNNSDHEKVIAYLKENVLAILDTNLNLTSAVVFESVFNKYRTSLKETQSNCVTLQHKLDAMCGQVNTANENVQQLREQLQEKTNECSLLQTQKEQILNISKSISVEIAKKEQEIYEIILENHKKLAELDIVSGDEEFCSSDKSNSCINLLVDRVIRAHTSRNKQQDLTAEINVLKESLQEKEKQLFELQKENQALKEVNNTSNLDLVNRQEELESLKDSHQKLNKVYENKMKENTNNLNTIDKLSNEIKNLKQAIIDKEDLINNARIDNSKLAELTTTIKYLQESNEQLKSVHQMMMQEKESCLQDLAKSCETIKQNNADMAQMTSDILSLRESLKEASSVIDTLKGEANLLNEENDKLKTYLDERTRECVRLETNIKTHEKTAEIQNRIIKRLKKQKEDDDSSVNDAQMKMKELLEKHSALLLEHEAIKRTVATLEDETASLKTAKETLEARVSEVQLGASERAGGGPECVSERAGGGPECVSERAGGGPECVSERAGGGPPHSARRDSIRSRKDNGDSGESPAGVAAARRRRQSVHDRRRPADLSSATPAGPDVIEDATQNNNEVQRLKEQLLKCEQELSELREEYRELDQECETCAEYLRDSEAACARLAAERAALREQLSTLKSAPRCTMAVADAAVNTDEDWTRLHSIVVDRMSYDAEVDKNKKLTKTVEELRYKKYELSLALDKMQRALDRAAGDSVARELESTKEELRSVRSELEDLKIRFKEVDEECELCAERLRESQEQCRRLGEARATLETKLSELQEESHAPSHSLSTRKRRQTIHDRNRPVSEQTESHEDRSPRYDKDSPSKGDVKHLKMMVDKLYQQKAELEQKLKATQVANPMFVATGSSIIQNQQITDVMKENQRLKKMNAKLMNVCKKRGKDTNRENVDPCEQNAN